MPEPTKKHRTEEIELLFVGPAGKKAAAISALHRLGYVPSEGKENAGAWRESFPELRGNESGVYLSGARHREGLTQRELAAKSGIPQRHISEMENGKRPIGKKNAKVFASILNADYRAFL
ncbi:MAG TPA: XRE family transcriptional regulator [Desulfobulbaceae bacterium]|nr:XRE family transcriptional regulator [Desulfobulbaceae bacterium]